MWWKPYESILERKPVEAKEALLDLLAQELVEGLEAFPPADQDMAWSDPVLEHRFAGKMATLPKVDVPMVDILAQILTFELEHEPEKVDHLLRNDLHREAFPTAAHDGALQLLWRGTLEHLYVRKEDASGALKSKDLVTIVERMADRFRRKAMLVH